MITCGRGGWRSRIWARKVRQGVTQTSTECIPCGELMLCCRYRIWLLPACATMVCFCSFSRRRKDSCVHVDFKLGLDTTSLHSLNCTVWYGENAWLRYQQGVRAQCSAVQCSGTQISASFARCIVITWLWEKYDLCASRHLSFHDLWARLVEMIEVEHLHWIASSCRFSTVRRCVFTNEYLSVDL